MPEASPMLSTISAVEQGITEEIIMNPDDDAMVVLGCHVSRHLIDRWGVYLVADAAPYFLTDDARELLPAQQMVFTRQEFAANFVDAPLELRDSYAIYAVAQTATWVALITSQAFSALPRASRDQLNYHQWQLGRGQIYPIAIVRDVLQEWPTSLERAEKQTFATPEGDKLVLQHAFWWSLPSAARDRWLQWFVAHDREECLAAQLAPAMWTAIAGQMGPHLQALAGSFASHSGPNCLGTTLAALASDLSGLADLWVHQAPFLRTLHQLRYEPQPLPDDLAAIPAGAVLAWQNAHQIVQHACCVIAPGLALNKDAQGWFAPRQILPVTRIVANWADADLTLHLYLPAAVEKGSVHGAGAS